MKDYSVLDNMIRMVGDTIKQAFGKGYKQGYMDGKDEAYKIIEEESHNARPLIREIVEKHIREYDFHELERDEIGDVIWEVIMNKILKPREENEPLED